MVGLAPACHRARALAAADGGTPGVRVHIPLTAGPFGSTEERDAIYALSDRVHGALEPADAGVIEGNEFGGGECVMMLRGRDPARTWQVVEPLLRATEFVHGGHADLHGGSAPDRTVGL